MSESRQRFTGRFLAEVVGLLFPWLLFVTLPLFTSGLQISTMDPRWMTPADLTWRRLVFNLLSKPGIRAMLVGGAWLVASLLRLMWRESKMSKRQSLAKVTVARSLSSLEWAIDGARRTSLMEYGSFVGVI